MGFFNIKKESSPKWFIAAFTVARITMGAFFSITGPTLPILASNMGVSLAVAQTAISRIFRLFLLLEQIKRIKMEFEIPT